MGTSSNFGNMFSMAGASVFLPFLPMLSTQVLLNNLLYDLAQITIPTDNVLLHFFHAGEVLFHTGWFVESLATQTLVLFVIRTPRNPLRSRPSLPLAITTIAIVVVGVILPYSPLAGVLGFEPLPAGYFLFLTAASLTYLVLVEIAKRYLLGDARKYRHHLPITSPENVHALISPRT